MYFQLKESQQYIMQYITDQEILFSGQFSDGISSNDTMWVR